MEQNKLTAEEYAEKLISEIKPKLKKLETKLEKLTEYERRFCDLMGNDFPKKSWHLDYPHDPVYAFGKLLDACVSGLEFIDLREKFSERSLTEREYNEILNGEGALWKEISEMDKEQRMNTAHSYLDRLAKVHKLIPNQKELLIKLFGEPEGLEEKLAEPLGQEKPVLPHQRPLHHFDFKQQVVVYMSKERRDLEGIFLGEVRGALSYGKEDGVRVILHAKLSAPPSKKMNRELGIPTKETAIMSEYDFNYLRKNTEFAREFLEGENYEEFVALASSLEENDKRQ